LKANDSFWIVLPTLIMAASSFGEEIRLEQRDATPPPALRSGVLNLRDASSLKYDFTSPGLHSNQSAQFGIPSTFSERVVLQSRSPLAEGLSTTHSTGLGLNRTGSFWRGSDRRTSGDEESLLYHDTGLEWKPFAALTLRGSSRLVHAVQPDGLVREDWSSGLALGLTPATGTSLYAGGFLSENLQSGAKSQIFTTGLDVLVPQTGLTLSASLWSMVGQSPSDLSVFSNLGFVGSVGWHLTKAIWQAVGVQSDAFESASWEYASWRYYLSTIIRMDAKTSLQIELSHTRTSDRPDATASAAKLQETRLRISRRIQILENLSSELSLEWAVGSLTTDAPDAFPAIRIAGQLAF